MATCLIDKKFSSEVISYDTQSEFTFTITILASKYQFRCCCAFYSVNVTLMKEHWFSFFRHDLLELRHLYETLYRVYAKIQK